VNPASGTYARTALPLFGICLSALLYLGALRAPALSLGGNTERLASGSTLLLQGWRTLQAGYPEWLANPLLWFAWLAAARGHSRLALASALLALALMSGFLLRERLDWPAAHLGAPVVQRHLGYWLWTASAFTMALSTAASAWPRVRFKTTSGKETA
jgi:hypothetical protein